MVPSALAVLDSLSMATAVPFPPVFPLCGVLHAPGAPLQQALDWACSYWNTPPQISPVYPFTATTYYEGEMGGPLHRMFWIFPAPSDPSDLADWKIASNTQERLWAREGCRSINLDPGTFSPSALVMATTKNHAHRIPLRDGIYAHLELLFHRRGPQALPWTYPDFAAKTYHPFLMQARTRMLEALRQEERQP